MQSIPSFADRRCSCRRSGELTQDFGTIELKSDPIQAGAAARGLRSLMKNERQWAASI
jgi:hypothetical protein